MVICLDNFEQVADIFNAENENPCLFQNTQLQKPLIDLKKLALLNT